MATIVGTGGDDRIDGFNGATNDADSISGLAGNDTLSGLDGADTLDGGDGADSIDGGLGADSLRGGGGGDTILAGDGANAVDGGGGNDSIIGGFDNDSLRGGDGADSIEGGQGNNTLDGGGGADQLVCGTGDDLLRGGAGNDFLDGGGGDDRLDGGTGADAMRGNFGDDVYIVDNAQDTIQEFVNDGDDLVLSSVSFTLSDNLESLDLTGSAAINGIGNDGNNFLYGNSAANRLAGGDGVDYLQGDGGADTLLGGTGNDVFRYTAISDSTPAQADHIIGFDGPGGAAGDRIELGMMDANVTRPGHQDFIFGGPFTAGHVRLSNVGGNTLVEVNFDNDAAAEMRLIIEDGFVNASAYSASDFVLTMPA